MATTTKTPVNFIQKNYTSEQFTLAGGAIGNLSFPTVSMEGYTCVGWRYYGGNNAGIRDNIELWGSWANMHARNNSSGSISGTVTIACYFVANTNYQVISN